MASFRSGSIRHLIGRQLPSPRIVQRRWARVHDIRFLVTHGSQERIAARYRDKLDQKAKEEGHGNIETLKEAYKDKIDTLRKSAAVPGATAPLQTEPSQSSTPFQPPPPPPSQSTASAATKATANIRTLSSFIDIPKTLELPQKEIEYIWRLRHANDAQSLCAVVPSNVWETIYRNARKHPQFILPLPREASEQNDGGAEIHFLQWTFPSPTTATVLFTHLAEYKLRGEYSTPHTSVTHHLDLAGPKGVVLVQGNVIPNRGISVEEGKWLLMCLQKFYGLQGEERQGRKKLLEQFSNGDGNFKVEELLEEAERI